MNNLSVISLQNYFNSLPELIWVKCLHDEGFLDKIYK